MEDKIRIIDFLISVYNNGIKDKERYLDSSGDLWEWSSEKNRLCFVSIKNVGETVDTNITRIFKTDELNDFLIVVNKDDDVIIKIKDKLNEILCLTEEFEEILKEFKR